ncbi:MAG: helix-turn-helix domain-containing protein [Acidimicrobiia bacterium]
MCKTVLAQVADLILEETIDTDTAELTQAVIASLLAGSRQTINESIDRLGPLGAVETGYRRIAVIDRAVVADVAAEHLA